MTTMHTPWGPPQDIEELAEVRDAMFTPAYAEEDCEEPIVRTLLGLGDDREREAALRTAEYFERYAPALPYLRGKGADDGYDHAA